MEETDHGVLEEDSRDMTGFTFSLVLTPITDGQTGLVETEVRVCCGIGATDHDSKHKGCEIKNYCE